MASFNRVILMGNLTRDPEIRYTNNGQAICKLGLAVNRRFKDQSGEWKEEPTFVDVTIFGKRGEAFAKFHTKGKPAFVEGELRLDTWEDKGGGGKRSKLYVVGNNWEFVGSGKGGSEHYSSDEEPSSAAGAAGTGAAGPDYYQAEGETPF